MSGAQTFGRAPNVVKHDLGRQKHLRDTETRVLSSKTAQNDTRFSRETCWQRLFGY